jgi:dehydrogenase/reductase SDR family protein 12
MDIEERVRSGRSADEVWAKVGDFSRLAEWDPGVARVERVGSGPVVVGTRYVVTVRVGPLTMPMDYVVERLEARRIVLRGTSWWIEAVDDVAVVADGAAAVVIWRAKLSPAGLLRWSEPLWRPGFRATADKAMAGLAAWVA